MTNARPALFLVIALVLFGVALALALGAEPWRATGTANAPAIAPNVLAGLASFGFAVAGGLSVIAAALAPRDRTPPGM
jgi:hypothetical protein